MDPDDEDHPSITFRPPTPDDARVVWQMARDSGALDLNSPYAYLLVCDHFAATSLVAEEPDGRLVGFVAAYRPPTEPDVVFVWQIAVDPARRGHGIAQRMLHALVDRLLPLGVLGLTATVTPGNEPSRRLFQSLARDRRTRFEERPLYDEELFPGEGHEAEHRVLIAPLAPTAPT
ncbi:diaminobutyrate acetyltransferase [Actinomarinicola tropica]|uniref:L-2,4-diaminobutyric acid acetyltransferase n=1 Tax=Actinomarinicola tropica TaxID=2789776 RepID=A0A5Q2RPM1_9ACTN|nr:diaminobutyrate acetyltransferase [Actinomarinicola tropica]QGG96531.1 diaminobutyrate acetyltransferase [Actinomarinicola tropica]